MTDRAEELARADAEVSRILALTDDELIAETDVTDAAWARGFKLGLKQGRALSTPWNSDMSAAPRDGTRFLGADAEGTIQVIFYGKFAHVPLYGFINQVEICDQFVPIAWMPLPPPPVGGEG